MVDPQTYKGIEYVRLNELPEEQKRIIKETLSKDLVIKILINGELCNDCVQYKDYTHWFKHIFTLAKKATPTPVAKGLSNVN